MEFKQNTPNFSKLEQLINIYDKLDRYSCITPDDEEEKKVLSDQAVTNANRAVIIWGYQKARKFCLLAGAVGGEQQQSRKLMVSFLVPMLQARAFPLKAAACKTKITNNKW